MTKPTRAMCSSLVVASLIACGGSSTPPPVTPPPPPPADETAQAETKPATPVPPPTCTASQILEGNACVDVATTLAGLRWEMPCKPHKPGETCKAATPKPSQSVQLGGAPGSAYDVKLRFRGVVELMSYSGGTADALWYVGGKPANKTYNIYALEVSAPAQTYYLNAGKAGIRHTSAIDYTTTIRVEGGATLTLSADAQDGALITNRDDKKNPIVVPDVPPAPEPFDGQFIQMDVVSVSRAP